MEAFTVPGSEIAKGCLAQPGRFFEHRFENRLKIARRGIDDAENFSGCGLLLQGFVSFRERLVPLGDALGKLTPEVGYYLLRIV
jgi:hypothetical protein